jgi:nitrogen regulatory protein P-II 1
MDYESKPVMDRYKYLRIVKLEIVYSDEDVERFIGVFQKLARTGSQGDGRIFVSENDVAVRIRHGAHGEANL